ncbi:TetR/AcrR family transcriptional regulator [Bradyrhizobium viridifuturi]|uniref:TetR/AcrR family transcriptional regulator n=1 Tax=Bradyrhizobium viridifuturi TaxID=1654716 RepID=UPI000B1DC279|nr:TetR/AcrR family transcriptional regulator [Bradyrhizobium viridifuturi]
MLERSDRGKAPDGAAGDRSGPARGRGERGAARREVQRTARRACGAALETLGELGFARTSLREIAQNSAFTHGVFHYYFSDKLDLICCCVRHYKAKCVTRYDEVVTTARSRDELTEGFLAKLAATLRDEARMHRLWYDLRSQAMFEPAFRKDVLEIDKSLEAMIWRIATRYAELGNKKPASSPAALYALFDGLFQSALLRHLADDEKAVPDLLDEVRRLLPTIC